MLVLPGVVESAANVAGATPFGTGSIDLQGGRLFVHPSGGSTGANIAVRAATAPGATLTYAAGSEIKVDRTTSGASWSIVGLKMDASDPAYAGQHFYSSWFLRVYDLLVLGLRHGVALDHEAVDPVAVSAKGNGYR